MQDLREDIVNRMRWGLYGPNYSDKRETLDLFNELREHPTKIFITGIVSPQLNSSEDEEAEDETKFSKTATNDSSHGFTFAVKKDDNSTLEIGADYSIYKEENKSFVRESIKKRYQINISELLKNHVSEEILHDFGSGHLIKLILTQRKEISSSNKIIFTLSIVHYGKEAKGFRPYDKCLFHTRIWAKSESFDALPLSANGLTENEKQGELLYRNHKRYALGHSCGTQYIRAESRIESSFFPSADVPVVTHKKLDSNALSMLHWAADNHNYEVLFDISKHYKNWIHQQLEKSHDLSDSQKVTLTQNIEDADSCCKRIEEGIQTLMADEKLQTAFKLMNEAMLKQQILSKQETLTLDADNEYVDFDVLDISSWPVQNKEFFGKWRLFQMAFILMSLKDIRNHEDNAMMDLIWFPTGGGKTEAYLGLSAFSLLYNRLDNDEHKGVKIIMRYTLRLLTAQQFERAAVMILCLDDIRLRESNHLGDVPFQIGLWVGGSVSFNRHGNPTEEYTKNPKTANQWYDNLSYKYPMQWPWVLQKCPRCNRPFGLEKKGDTWQVYGVKRNKDDNKIIFSCKCSRYNQGWLPITVVDEDIYDNLPSLVIGTVDKFARLSWKPESSKILGINALGNNRHSKLSLIIQDELHLLEGPLGTIVGLYESGIDFLIQSTGANPKRIGSSATLAMAKEQCMSLYGLQKEEVQIFPPQVLDWDDNFFSHVDKRKPGRKYVGVYANGSPSNKTTQYKLFASLKESSHYLIENNGEEYEGYSTMLNYFNSTKDLGHSLSLLGDDVPQELRRLQHRYGVENNHKVYLDIGYGLEQLHGKVNSSDIQKSMHRLTNKRKEKNHVHTVLATNMISVGLDVSRLSLMTIIHQPKSMSEYIQSSSRIGRGSTPGLVCVMLSALRTRDRSHLEDFEMTHAKMYSLVEPSSLTPFSLTALNRAFAGVLIAVFRNHPKNGMSQFKSLNEDVVAEVRSFYEKRVGIIDPASKIKMLEIYDDICKKWISKGFRTFGKETHINFAERPLMVPYLTSLKGTSVEPFQVLQAMRNVDSNITIKKIENGQ